MNQACYIPALKTNPSAYLILGCFAKEGEPTCFTWIGQANTPRLKARYQFQLALVNTITFAILIFCFPALFFTVPALILAVQVIFNIISLFSH